MVERPLEVNELLNLLKGGTNSVGLVGSRTVDVGICGMGGVGKTVLAQAIAWSVASTRQVIWLDIGPTPDCLALINVLVKALGGAYGKYARIRNYFPLLYLKPGSSVAASSNNFVSNVV